VLPFSFIWKRVIGCQFYRSIRCIKAPYVSEWRNTIRQYSISATPLPVLDDELSKASAIARRLAAECFPVVTLGCIRDCTYEAVVEVSAEAYVSSQDTENFVVLVTCIRFDFRDKMQRILRTVTLWGLVAAFLTVSIAEDWRSHVLEEELLRFFWGLCFVAGCRSFFLRNTGSFSRREECGALYFTLVCEIWSLLAWWFPLLETLEINLEEELFEVCFSVHDTEGLIS